MSRITQLLSTPGTVITLGKLVNVALMWSPSELVNGSEPHDHILSGAQPALTSAVYMLDGGAVGRCTRGGAAGWYREGYYTGY